MVALVTYNEIAAVSGDEPRDLFFFAESHDFSNFFFCMRSDEIICRTAHTEGRMIFHRFCGLYRIFPCNCIKFSDNLFFDHDFYPLPHLRPNISLRITTNYRLYFLDAKAADIPHFFVRSASRCFSSSSARLFAGSRGILPRTLKKCNELFRSGSFFYQIFRIGIISYIRQSFPWILAGVTSTI